MAVVHCSVRKSVVGAMPAPVCWSIVKRFGEMGQWMPSFTTQMLAGQQDGEVGAVRCTYSRKCAYHEQLTCLDSETRTMKWKVVSHPGNANPYPGPCWNFRAKLTVHEVTVGKASFIEFEATFDTDADHYAAMEADISGVLEGGLLSLQALGKAMHHALPVASCPAAGPPTSTHPLPQPRTSLPGIASPDPTRRSLHPAGTASPPLPHSPTRGVPLGELQPSASSAWASHHSGSSPRFATAAESPVLHSGSHLQAQPVARPAPSAAVPLGWTSAGAPRWSMDSPDWQPFGRQSSGGGGTAGPCGYAPGPFVDKIAAGSRSSSVSSEFLPPVPPVVHPGLLLYRPGQGDSPGTFGGDSAYALGGFLRS